MSMGRLTELQFYTLENVPLKMNGCAISQFFFLFFFFLCVKAFFHCFESGTDHGMENVF